MSNRHEMGRREFLVLSSACALATAAVGPKLFAGEKASVPKSLAVGFAAFDDAAVTDAARVPSADGGFIGRGARIGVSGASGVSPDPIDRRAVELLAHFTYLEGAERRTTPFRAWSCSRLTGCEGSRLQFNVPVDEVQKLSFTVVAERGAPAGAASRRQALTKTPTETIELPLSLSITSEEGTLKLARGFYVIVPMFEGDATPDWSRYTVRTVEGGRWSLVDVDGNIASFEHFVLRIDYATL